MIVRTEPPNRLRRTTVNLGKPVSRKSSSAAVSRPTQHGGVKVLREELIENLPGAPMRISRLYLEANAIAYACRDCLYTADKRGTVMVHRNEDHGVRLARKPGVALPKLEGPPDPILPERADGTRPSDPLKWTLGELLAVAPSLTALGDLVEKSELALEAALAELLVLRQAAKANQAKVEGYSAIHAELVEARTTLYHAKDYDEIRAEMMALRMWKRKITTRLKNVGFVLSEEDQ